MSLNDDLKEFQKMVDKLGDVTTIANRLAAETINSQKGLSESDKHKLKSINFGDIVSKSNDLGEIEKMIKTNYDGCNG